MNIQFSGQTVIVTGAAHGFGRAIALAFAERGAQVWGCDLLADELAETKQLCEDAGGECEVRTVDVSDRDTVFAFVQEVLEQCDTIHVLVNCAGACWAKWGDRWRRSVRRIGTASLRSITAVSFTLPKPLRRA
ncbi:MAG: SDR family NAD(P)-dependent oxidoreductase [Caldilineaceae bacterium]